MPRRRSDSRIVDVTATVRNETSSAFLLWNGKHQAWVPKSQVQENDDGTFSMPEWLAQEKELI